MRRITFPALTLALLGALFTILSPPAEAGPGPCGGSEVEVRGRVTDVTTGLPLTEVTGVEYAPQGSGTPADGDGTNPDTSRYSVCLLPDTYDFTFRADSYRVDAAAHREVQVTGDGPIIVNVALTPRGLVLAGRITNSAGRPVFASIGIYRQRPNGRWVSIDGEGNDPANGIWSYRVPGPGRYRVNASVDHHWSRWHRNATRLRHARVLVVNATHLYARNVDIAVPYCTTGGGAFCVPPGFLT
jgi:hypothetical protein